MLKEGEGSALSSAAPMYRTNCREIKKTRNSPWSVAVRTVSMAKTRKVDRAGGPFQCAESVTRHSYLQIFPVYFSSFEKKKRRKFLLFQFGILFSLVFYSSTLSFLAFLFFFRFLFCSFGIASILEDQIGVDRPCCNSLVSSQGKGAEGRMRRYIFFFFSWGTWVRARECEWKPVIGQERTSETTGVITSVVVVPFDLPKVAK